MKLLNLFVLVVFALPSLAASTDAPVSEKKGLTLEGAGKVIAAAEVYAKVHGAPEGAIAVVDDGGNLMALERLDGTFSAGPKISVGKAHTAVLFKKPTKFFEDLINGGRTTMVALEDFTPESFGAHREMLGVQGMAEIVRDTAALPLAQMKQEILERVSKLRGGPAVDDMSFVLAGVLYRARR